MNSRLTGAVTLVILLCSALFWQLWKRQEEDRALMHQTRQSLSAPSKRPLSAVEAEARKMLAAGLQSLDGENNYWTGIAYTMTSVTTDADDLIAIKWLSLSVIPSGVRIRQRSSEEIYSTVEFSKQQLDGLRRQFSYSALQEIEIEWTFHARDHKDVILQLISDGKEFGERFTLLEGSQ